MKDLTSKFGQNVRKVRLISNITQEELAQFAGIDRGYMGHIERGTKSPTLAKVEKIAKALNIHSATLLQDP